MILKNKLIASNILILIVTAVAFLPTLNNDFIRMDDPAYVVENEMIRDVSWTGVKNMLTNIHRGLYKPVVFISFAIEHHFLGLNPRVYHATNLIFHLLNTLLVFWFVYRMRRHFWTAVVVSAFFGVHPLHVESVAWITERKDMLTAFFFLLSLISYLYYQEISKFRYYVSALIFFALCLLSKPIAMMMPLTLLALDYVLRRPMNRILWIEKIPFVVISTGYALFALYTQHLTHILAKPFELGLRDTLLTTAYSLTFYVTRLFLPLNLSVLYPHPRMMGPTLPWDYVFSPLIVAALVYGAYRCRTISRTIPFGLCFYALMLLPVLQVIPSGPMGSVADRYAYLSSIGIFYILGEGMETALRTMSPLRRAYRITLLGVFCLVSGIFASATWNRCLVWKNNETIWNDVMKKYPQVPQSYFYRGTLYRRSGRHQKALTDYNTALKLYPHYEAVLNNRGVLYLDMGRPEDAVRDFSRALSINPLNGLAYDNREAAYERMGLAGFKGEFLDYAVWREPEGRSGQNVSFADAKTNAEKLKQNMRGGIRLFTHLIGENPDDPRNYYNRANFYADEKQYDKAVADYDQALRLDPRSAPAYNNRGTIHQLMGNLQKALEDYNRALALDANLQHAYFNRGLILKALGRDDEAREAFDRFTE